NMPAPEIAMNASPDKTGLLARLPERVGRAVYCLLVVSAVLFLGAPAAHGQTYRFCFPSVTWFGGAPPVIDGNVAVYPGGRGALRYVIGGNGTPAPSAFPVVVQGITDGSSLYLSFDAPTPVFDPTTLIVITIAPDGDATHFRQINLSPVISAA